MVKPPGKRRGISLGARAETAAALELLNPPHSDSGKIDSDKDHSLPETASGQSGATPEVMKDEVMKEQLAELRRLGADLDLYWERQFDQLQEQSRQLKQQRVEIARQTQQLQALKQTQRSARRVVALLSLLALVGAAAAGFHTWPRLQGLASDWNRVSSGVVQLAPRLEVVHGQVASLTSDMEQIGSDMTTLRKDVSMIRSESGSAVRVADAPPEGRPAVKTKAPSVRNAAYSVRRDRSSTAHPHWAVRRMRPW